MTTRGYDTRFGARFHTTLLVPGCQGHELAFSMFIPIFSPLAAGISAMLKPPTLQSASHMRTWILAASGVLLPCLVWAEDPVVPAGQISLREFCQSQSGQQFYGLYLLGRKVGWASEAARLESDAHGEVFLMETDGELRIQFFGVESSYKFSGRNRYALSAEGPLIAIEETNRDGESTSRFSAELREEGYDAILESEGQITKLRTGPSKDNLQTMFEFNKWLGGKRSEGDVFVEHSFDFEKLGELLSDAGTPSPDEEQSLTFVNRRATRWGGALVTISSLKVKTGSMSFEMQVRQDGTPTKFSMGPIEARMEEEAVAKDLALVVGDMLGAVPVETDMGPPEKVGRAVLELYGIGNFQIPESETQQVIESRRNYALVSTRRVGKPANTLPLSAEKLAKWTAATLRIQSDQPKIIALAQSLVAEETDPVAQADLLQDWVYQNLEGSYSKNADTALRVLENKAGDCTEHALLFVALARSLKLPAREVAGLIFHNEPRPGFYWHAWAEIHDGQRWRGIDPAFHEVDIDAAHLKLVEALDDWSWIEVFGRLKVKVREFESLE